MLFYVHALLLLAGVCRASIEVLESSIHAVPDDGRKLISVNTQRLDRKYHKQDVTDRDAPWAEAWANSLAICATMRNENVTDVVEWLQYHKCASIGLETSTCFPGSPCRVDGAQVCGCSTLPGSACSHQAQSACTW